MQLITLNKTCRFCPYCELIIVKKGELESLLVAALEERAPEIIGNEYLVLGTLDRKDWNEAQTREVSSQDALGLSYRFKDVWHFEVIPAGWYPADG